MTDDLIRSLREKATRPINTATVFAYQGLLARAADRLAEQAAIIDRQRISIAAWEQKVAADEADRNEWLQSRLDERNAKIASQQQEIERLRASVVRLGDAALDAVVERDRVQAAAIEEAAAVIDNAPEGYSRLWLASAIRALNKN